MIAQHTAHAPPISAKARRQSSPVPKPAAASFAAFNTAGFVCASPDMSGIRNVFTGCRATVRFLQITTSRYRLTQFVRTSALCLDKFQIIAPHHCHNSAGRSVVLLAPCSTNPCKRLLPFTCCSAVIFDASEVLCIFQSVRKADGSAKGMFEDSFRSVRWSTSLYTLLLCAQVLSNELSNRISTSLASTLKKKLFQCYRSIVGQRLFGQLLLTSAWRQTMRRLKIDAQVSHFSGLVLSFLEPSFLSISLG